VNDFEKFVMHVRNLKTEGIEEATFNVAFLSKVLENIPTQEPKKVSNNVIGDGGKFSDE
jgi:hypothetical protein|tara:strand:+ start:148 stop:324 length:177 start_codon:yes stop_codon:yes gene_type:complete